MRDLQVMYLRSVVPATDIRPIAMLRLQYPPSGVPTSVVVDGASVPFLVTSAGTLLAVRPGEPPTIQDGVSRGKLAGWSVTAHAQEDAAAYVLPDDQVLDVEAALIVRVRAATDVVMVLLNQQSVGFTKLSETALLVEIPKVARLEQLTVLASTSQVSEDALLEFRLQPGGDTVEGIQKLVGQFVKLLLTTPGTSLLDRDAGGGLGKGLGSESTSQPALFSAILQKITQAAVQLTRSQLQLALPPSEQLLSAQVTGMTTDPTDPGRAFVSIRLLTVAGTQAAFGSTLGGVA